MMEIRDILEHLPHRYPFLLVDRILDMEAGKRVTGLKNVTINEPFFVGHFPHLPVMPGVLIIEAMAQAAAMLAFASAGRKPDDRTVIYFVGIDNARFKRPVVPGDQLMLHAELTHSRRDIWKFSAQAKVEGALAAEADLMCTVRDIE